MVLRERQKIICKVSKAHPSSLTAERTEAGYETH